MRFGSGLALSVVAAVFNSGSTLLVNVAVAKLMGPQVFGEFSTVMSTVLTLATLASLGLPYTATKFVAEFRSVDSAKVGRVLGLCSTLSGVFGAVCGLGLLVAAPSVGGVLRNDGLSSGLALASAAVFLSVRNAFYTGVLAGFEGYRGIATAGAVGGASYLLFGVAGAALAGRDGALAGIVLSLAVQALALRSLTRSRRRAAGVEVSYRGMALERAAALHFAIPSALSGFSATAALWLAVANLVRQPGGYSEMAFFAAAASLRTLALFVPQLANSVGMSIINNSRAAGSERYWRVFRANLYVAVGTAFAGAVVIWISRHALLSLFGGAFTRATPVLLVMLLAAVLEALTVALYQPVQSEGRMWLSILGVSLPRDSCLVLSSLLLVPAMGAYGLAAAQALSGGVAVLGTLVLILHLRRTMTLSADPLVSSLSQATRKARET